MVQTRSKKQKRQRLISISSHVSSWPNVPARFESLNDDTLTTVLQFVGNQSYRSFGGVNYHCREIYLNTNEMTKETFLFGYAPLSAIKEIVERAIEDDDWEFQDRVGKGVVSYDRRDVLEWAKQNQNYRVLNGICNVAAEEGRIDIMDEVRNNIYDDYENEDDKKHVFQCVFGCVDSYAVQGGKLGVFKWLDTKEIDIDKELCALEAAHHGQLHILEWLREEKGLQLSGELYYHAIGGNHLHVMKWLREQEVPWYKRTFKYAAIKGNLDVLQWLHSEGCPWSRGSRYRIRESKK